MGETDGTITVRKLVMLFLMFLDGTEMHCDVGFGVDGDGGSCFGPPLFVISFSMWKKKRKKLDLSSGDMAGLFFFFFSLGFDVLSLHKEEG